MQSLHILSPIGMIITTESFFYTFPGCSSKQRNWGNEEVEPAGPQVVQQEALYRQSLFHETPKGQGGG